MPRQTRRKRRSFGSVEEKTKNGRKYLYYSFKTPVWAFSKWPELNLGDRQWHSVTPGNEYEGEAWLAAAQKAIKAETWVPDKLREDKERRESITFRQYAVPWVENRKKANGDDLKQTAKQKYRESLDLYLLDYFGDMRMTTIKPKDVQRWWDTFKPARLDADLEDRRYHVYKHLKTIMASAATEPVDDAGNTLIAVNPCQIKAARPKPKHTPIRPTAAQLDAFLTELPEWARVVAMICDVAGLREGEALGLCRRHIDLEGLTIHVEQQAQRVPDGNGKHSTQITTPKTASSIRDVRITRALADTLRNWMDTHGITVPAAPLFVSPRTGRQLYPQNYRGAVARARKKVPGLESMRPHDLRKDALSRMTEAGATVSEVMRQGGHTSMSVASIYQTTGDHLGEVIDRMDADTLASVPSEDATFDGTVTIPLADRQANQPDNNASATAAQSDNELVALAGVLADMPIFERVTVLRSLPINRRAAVVGVLSDAVRVETLTELLKG
ncbi:tyrosine-type recombinase/integrase family protein [Bifidobacterium sp. 82T10]|uniref:Tyrosine-type recombinase/integrase family protein n=1 Tax=Bifidobacterium miconis TaxID=2834435 RepID=A0ABS6WED5_9BIFI|nr:site-specific integrase [Bifidobacterium miconis]MBW3092393.1 tyrosine-type recombinase/integrase family protein [Bifidobacterium miconis]